MGEVDVSQLGHFWGCEVARLDLDVDGYDGILGVELACARSSIYNDGSEKTTFTLALKTTYSTVSC